MKAQAVFVVCILIGFSKALGAASPNEEPENISPPVTEAGQDEHIQNLDQGITAEESMRLRRALVEYSRAVDPSHIQIEERRRLMRKRIQERFFGSDKDNNGVISRQEAAETLPQIFRHFSQVDLNDDGAISVSELEAVQTRATERQQAAEARVEEAQQAAIKRKNNQAAATE